MRRSMSQSADFVKKQQTYELYSAHIAIVSLLSHRDLLDREESRPLALTCTECNSNNSKGHHTDNSILNVSIDLPA